MQYPGDPPYRRRENRDSTDATKFKVDELHRVGNAATQLYINNKHLGPADSRRNSAKTKDAICRDMCSWLISSCL